MIGPLLRFDYRVVEQLELTGRIGYLTGLSTTTSGFAQGSQVDTHLSGVPIWMGARYFFMKDKPFAGVYGAAELGMNLLYNSSVLRDSTGQSITLSDSYNRFGFDLGAGYIISRELPIDFRLQYTMLNLLGRVGGETTAHAIGVSAGYTFQL
jgi:hypothetical protein